MLHRECEDEDPVEDEEARAKPRVAFGVIPSLFAEVDLLLLVAKPGFEEVLALWDGKERDGEAEDPDVPSGMLYRRTRMYIQGAVQARKEQGGWKWWQTVPKETRACRPSRKIRRARRCDRRQKVRSSVVWGWRKKGSTSPEAEEVRRNKGVVRAQVKKG